MEELLQASVEFLQADAAILVEIHALENLVDTRRQIAVLNKAQQSSNHGVERPISMRGFLRLDLRLFHSFRLGLLPGNRGDELWRSAQ